jgi:hypothetical protein
VRNLTNLILRTLAITWPQGAFAGTGILMEAAQVYRGVRLLSFSRCVHSTGTVGYHHCDLAAAGEGVP